MVPCEPGKSRAKLAAQLKVLLEDTALRKTGGGSAGTARAKVCAPLDNQKCIEPIVELFEREGGVTGHAAFKRGT